MRAERGEVGMRLLVLLGLVTAVIWVVPLVALRGQAPDATFGESLVLDEPAATGSGEGAAPATGATGATGPAATGSGSLDPVAQANALDAQSMLNDAIRVGQVFYAEQGTYQGFTPEVAKEYDPSIVYTLASPVPGMVTMMVTPTTVVLVTAVEGGGYLCAAADGDVVSFGQANALTPQQCQGGW